MVALFMRAVERRFGRDVVFSADCDERRSDGADDDLNWRLARTALFLKAVERRFGRDVGSSAGCDERRSDREGTGLTMI